MRRWSGREGQTEPLAALAAVAVVALAVSVYAGAIEASLPGSPDRNAAESAADRVERALTAGGVAVPARLPAAAERGPGGYHLNATLAAGDRTERVGPAAPETVDTARRRVSVRADPGRVVPGRLEVHVWT